MSLGKFYNNNFTREVISKSSKLANYNEQDNIYHPEVYNDIVSKSTMLNTPIGDRFITFKQTNKFDTESNVLLYGDQLDKTYLYGFTIEDPIITISQSKEVVRTKVKGLDGDILEVNQNGSYEINIVGTFAGNAFWLYDVDNLKLLEIVSNIKTTLEILNPSLNDVYGITDLVVIDHKIAQSQEFTNVTAIELNCVSSNKVDIFESITFTKEDIKIPSFQSKLGG